LLGCQDIAILLGCPGKYQWDVFVLIKYKIFINKKVGNPYPCKHPTDVFVHTSKGHFQISSEKLSSGFASWGFSYAILKNCRKIREKNSLVLARLTDFNNGEWHMKYRYLHDAGMRTKDRKKIPLPYFLAKLYEYRYFEA